MTLYTKRPPRDTFELSLYWRLLYSTFDRWARLPRPLTVSISDLRDDMASPEAAWDITITNPSRPFDLRTAFDQPAVHGRAWVVEDGVGSAKVWISLPEQPYLGRAYDNDADNPPWINWS